MVRNNPSEKSDTTASACVCRPAQLGEQHLLLGREDIDSTDPNLRKTPEANAQGPNRYVRGMSMFDAARKAASELDTNFRWQLVVVDDAAHVNAQMATAAAELVE